MRHGTWISFLLMAAAGETANAQYADVSYHASTAAEGAARGMSDMIQSAGAANLMNSEAAKNYEAARKQNIENRLTWTNTYWEMKRVNKEYRDAQRRPAPTQEQLVRMAKGGLPDRLAISQLDPLTGVLAWPDVLRAEPYAEYRVQIDKIYAGRAANGYLGPDQYLKVKQLTNEMTNVLKQNIKQYTSTESIQARKFLESVSFEANQQPS